MTSTADSGPGSLRRCLETAASGDTVTFDPRAFPPQSPAIIRLASGLSLGQGVTLDGTGAGVILDGGAAPPGTTGLHVGSTDSVVRGLQVLNFLGGGVGVNGSRNTIGPGNIVSGNGGAGILVCCGDGAAGNRVIGNHLGLDASGMNILGRQAFGIVISGARNVVGGPAPGNRNVVSGNWYSNVYLKVAFGNLVLGNYIGTDLSGRRKLPEPEHAALLLESVASSNRIERNVIAGGVSMGDLGTSYNEVVGNYIGTDVTGTIAFEGGGYVAVSQPYNRIGGTRSGEGNVINGRVSMTSDVLVLGNRIGTDASGKAVLQGTDQGVNVGGGTHNFIGGPTEAERNIINTDTVAVSLDDFAQYNFIVGNYIGTDVTGTILRAFYRGISLKRAEHNVVQSNLISGGQEAGIHLGQGANMNWLRANRIIQNSKVGIVALQADGNIIVGNSFAQNGHNGSEEGSGNRWDDGNEGNYWDDYKGTDSNADGIGDTPYPVPPNGVDNRPLMARR